MPIVHDSDAVCGMRGSSQGGQRFVLYRTRAKGQQLLHKHEVDESSSKRASGFEVKHAGMRIVSGQGTHECPKQQQVDRVLVFVHVQRDQHCAQPTAASVDRRSRFGALIC